MTLPERFGSLLVHNYLKEYSNPYYLYVSLLHNGYVSPTAKCLMMFHLRKLPLCLLLVAIASSVLCQVTYATAMNVTVPGGEEVTRPLTLLVEDRVAIKFTVVGGQSGNTLDFRLTYPNGTAKAAFDNVGNVNYGFICDWEGEYVMHFSNAGSSEDKLVSMDYEVQHYIFGMPQMLFLTMIIVVICVAAVAVFILMGKPH